MNKCVKYVVIDGCRLHFYNELPTAYNTPTGSLISSIDLIGLNFTQSATQIVFGSIVLDKSSLPPIIIGYNTPPVPFDLALIEAAIAMCGEPEPIIVDALNCDNTTTPTEVTQRVAIVAEKPIKVCIDGLTETVVYEKYCDIETGEVVGYAVLETTETVPPITAAKWFDLTFAPIAGMPAGAKVCSVIDVELFSNCYQDATDNSIKYTAVSLLNVGVTPIVSVGTIWYNAAGVVIAAPINVEPCAAPTEFDVVPSNWLPLCVDGVQWYVRESQVIDNNLGTVTITNKEYKQGANGAIVATAPTGTIITDGVCATIDVPITINAPFCDTTLPIDVDSTVGAYILNPQNRHTEKVFDIVTAQIGGTISYTMAGSLLSFTHAATVTNDAILYIVTDFGNGYFDIGNVPSFNYSNSNSGHYEVKVYVALASGNVVVLLALELDYDATTPLITPILASPRTINRPVRVTIGCALQDYCNGLVSGTPYLADGTAYTIVGTVSTCEAVVLDELKVIGEANGFLTASAGDKQFVPMNTRSICISGVTVQVGQIAEYSSTTGLVGTILDYYLDASGSIVFGLPINYALHTEGICKECCPTVFEGNICIDGAPVSVHYSIDPLTLTVLQIKGLDGTNYANTVSINDCSECPFALVTGEIYQTGANTIDNIDVYAFPDPAPNVTLTATDCLTLTLQFKDPITGANVGAAKSYTTNVGTPFTAADVTDWETSFGIFGGVQSWTGSDFSLTGWSKNTPQGAFLLPNPLLGYDIAFTFQIKKDCGTTIVSNVSAPVIATVIQTAIADNNTNVLSPVPYNSNITPTYAMGGIRLIEPINHPMVVYGNNGVLCGFQPIIILQNAAFDPLRIHNDGNWSLVWYERNYDNVIVNGSWSLTAGVEFRTAIVNAIVAANGSSAVPITPFIGVSYPALEFANCIDGADRLLAIDGTRVMETVKAIRLENTNGLAIEIVWNLIKSR